jgi:uncharacterized membrane protein YbhN (UPF0104 family)
MARPINRRRTVVGTIGLTAGTAIGVVLLYPVAKVLIPVLIFALVLALLIRTVKR